MKYLIMSVCVALLPHVVEAQSLVECIDYAQTHSLRIKAARLQQQRAKRQEASFFEIDKTELSLSQDPTSGGSPDNAFTLSQRIDFPTVYTSRKQVLKAETAVEAARTQLTAKELTKEVATVYTDVLARRHEAELLKQNDSVLAAFVHIAKIRFANGETNRLEVMNAEQMLAENQLRLQMALSGEKQSVSMLQSLINADFDVEPNDSYVPSSLLTDDLLLNNYAYTATPQGQLLSAEQRLAEQQLRHTRQGYMPSLSLGVRHQFVMSGLNPYDVDRSKFEKGGWMGFELGVAFPLFFGAQKAKTAVAKYDVEVASTRLAEQTMLANTDYQVARDAFSQALNNYQKWMGQSVPNAQEIRRLSLVEYQAGEITYVEHIQHLSSALDTELAAAEAADQLNKAIIHLNYITGK